MHAGLAIVVAVSRPRLRTRLQAVPVVGYCGAQMPQTENENDSQVNLESLERVDPDPQPTDRPPRLARVGVSVVGGPDVISTFGGADTFGGMTRAV